MGSPDVSNGSRDRKKYLGTLQNCLLYTEFQIASLYSKEHKGNRFFTERIGSLFNKIGTSLAVHMHACKTDINIQCIHRIMTSILSKQTYGECPPRLVR